MNQQGTWRKSLRSLAISIFVLLTIRWIALEPYVIPSGSMLPTLKVLDFIFVNKFAYGLRAPFSSTWIFKRDLPRRCDVVVFRSQTDPDTFVVKRVMGLPGEHIELFESGRLKVSGQALETTAVIEDDDAILFTESCDAKAPGDDSSRRHSIRLSAQLAELPKDPVVYSVTVPEGHLAMFGDNRHASADSRVWGTLPREDLLGQALGIWLSCEKSLPGTPRLCDPSSVRFERMFRGLDTK